MTRVNTQPELVRARIAGLSVALLAMLVATWQRLKNQGLQSKLQRVELLALDVDGVLTDGSLHYTHDGQLNKAFNVRDGLGIAMLRAAGVGVAVVTGRSDCCTLHRMEALGVPAALILSGCSDKRAGISKLSQQTGIPLGSIAFMGDDVIDLPALTVVGLPACPSDAQASVLRQCVFRASAPGGRGAVRQLAEAILSAKGHSDALHSAEAFLALMSKKATRQ